MGTYVVTGPDGHKYRVTAPEGTSDDQIADQIRTQYYSEGASTEAPSSPAPRQKNGGINSDDLLYDKKWLESARVVYRGEHTKEQADKATPEELHKYALQANALTSWNLYSAAKTMADTASASPERKEAIRYLRETYKEVNTDWTVAGNTALALLTDPTNLIGVGEVVNAGKAIGLIGAKAAAKQEGFNITSKQAVKAFVKGGTRTAVEGAAYGAAGNYMEQSIDVNVGSRKEVSGLEVAGAAGAGLILGKNLGGAGAVVAGKMAQRAEAKLARTATEEGIDLLTGAGTRETPSNLPGEASPSASMVAEGTRVADEATTSSEGTQLDLFNNASKEAPVEAPKVGAAPESTNLAQQIIDTVKASSTSDGGRAFISSLTDLSSVAAKAKDLILTMTGKNADEVTEVLRRFGFDPEQGQTFMRAIQDSVGPMQTALKEAIKDPNVDQAAVSEIMQVQEAVTNLFLDQSGQLGRGLRGVQDSAVKGEARDFATVTQVADDMGVNLSGATELEKQAVQEEWVRRVEGAEQMSLLDAEVAALDKQAADIANTTTMSAADIEKFVTKMDEKAAVLAEKEQQALADMGMGQKVWNKLKKFNDAVVEWVYANVFSLGTQVRNITPLLTELTLSPIERLMQRDLSRASLREMVTTYVAYGSSIRNAARAANAAFKFEKALLIGDDFTILNYDPAIPGKFGRGIRVFSRMLTWGDEFFSRIVYQGHVEGQATFQGLQLAAEKGLKGDARKEFVSKFVADEVNRSFEADLNKKQVLEFLYKKGVEYGKTGEGLTKFVQAEFEKRGDLFRQAANATGKDYLRDFLMKNEFSGGKKMVDGTQGGFFADSVSGMARGLDQFMSKNPWSKLLGMLFFRLPIRSFEKGMRLTPGVNLIAPRFMDELAGKYGPELELRAKAQLMRSHALGLTTLTLYGKGMITGSGPSDPKDKKRWQDAGNQEYSIKVGDTWVSYRAFWPIAVPFMIITNGMDRYLKIQDDKAHGLYQRLVQDPTNPSQFTVEEEGEAMDYMQLGFLSLYKAFSEANLTQGLADFNRLMEDLGDETIDAGDAMGKFIAKKADMFVSNQFQQAMSVIHPEMSDPKTMAQYLKSMINPADPTVPKQYDALGNVRTKANPTSALFGVNMATDEQLKKGRSDKEMKVLEAIKEIEQATGAHFTFPYKKDDLDLRTIYTSDGSQTYYDRLVQIYHNTDVSDVLYEAIELGGSVGTKKAPGVLSKEVQQIMSAYMDMAYAQLEAEQAGIIQSKEYKINRQAGGLEGAFDVPSRSPF